MDVENYLLSSLKRKFFSHTKMTVAVAVLKTISHAGMPSHQSLTPSWSLTALACRTSMAAAENRIVATLGKMFIDVRS